MLGFVVFKPIGFVKTPEGDEDVKKRSSLAESEVVVLPDYEEALDGIEEYSHIIVIYYMHKVSGGERRLLRIRPRRLVRYGFREDELPTVGVFASDSPARPNPIGFNVVELVERRGRVLRVRGLNAFDGTPVLDIKPYTPDKAIPNPRVPAWYRRYLEATRERRLGLASSTDKNPPGAS